MKLAICTDVFADLSYTDMLDKVKSLGIDAVEMTAGGWGARKHCNTAELLADAGKREAFMMELEKRGMRISALNTDRATRFGRPRPARSTRNPCTTAQRLQVCSALRRS